jgi:hypothetical protein
MARLTLKTGPELSPAITDLAGVQTSIMKKGLGLVALFALFRVQRSTRRLMLFNPWWLDITDQVEGRLRDALYLPEYVTSGMLTFGSEVRRLHGEYQRSPDDEMARFRLEWRLDSDAHELLTFLDNTISDTLLAQHDLLRVTDYLNRRIIGSWWVRVLGVVQK